MSTNEDSHSDYRSHIPKGYPLDLSAAEVRHRYLNLLGDVQTPLCDPQINILDESVLPGDIVRQSVEYFVEPNDKVVAYHMFRNGLPTSAHGLLAIHSHGGGHFYFSRGKDINANPETGDPHQYAYHAAQHGFRVLAPDALCFGDRRATFGFSTEFWDEIVVHAELCSRGKSLAWKSVYDNSRAVEVLEFLGAGRIGCIGHSGGSTQGYLLAAANPKIAAAVCFASFATMRDQLYRYRCVHCLYHYIPNMVKAGIDFDQVAATVAPRRLFLARGVQDEGTPESMYRAFVDAVRERCRRENLPDDCIETFETEGGHDMTPEMLAAALKFLAKNLGR